MCLLVPGLLGCGDTGEGRGRVEAGRPVSTVGMVRFSLPTPHRVVAERRVEGTWQDPVVVFEDASRECGAVRAIAAGETVAATIACDDHFAEDQAPTRSVALVSPDGRSWTHRDLSGEASSTPGLSPAGTHAVWVQGDGLLSWDGGSFATAAAPEGTAQEVTVDDGGTVAALSPRRSGEGARSRSVPMLRGSTSRSRRRRPACAEVGLSLASPTQIRGDVCGQPGTGFVIRRSGAEGWVVASRPPVAAPGLDRYPDDRARAIWNQLTENTSGDLVAMGSPDRQHITAQRYDVRRAPVEPLTGDPRRRGAGLPPQQRRLGGAAGGDLRAAAGVRRRAHRVPQPHRRDVEQVSAAQTSTSWTWLSISAVRKASSRDCTRLSRGSHTDS